MRQWNFYDRVYRRWVCLEIGSFEEFKTEIESLGASRDVMECIVVAKGLCIELNDGNNTTGQRCTIIWMPKYETATLVHEISHLVMMCFEQVGVPISRDNTEAFAFYAEFWFGEMQRARKKYPDGKPPKLAKQ
jgi:hypothetical protein